LLLPATLQILGRLKGPAIAESSTCAAMDMSADLQRFKDAQSYRGSGFDAALADMQSGRKRGHWIWYVFPQLAGLGQSTMSQTYGIDGIAEAEEYLRDPVLRGRLLTMTIAVSEQLRRGVSIESLMNSSIDATKLVSSMTLFGNVAKRLHAAERLDDYASLARLADEVLAIADAQGYPPCAFTLDRLRELPPGQNHGLRTL
jgi:uncharacterized protein (DUF1810 family)